MDRSFGITPASAAPLITLLVIGTVLVLLLGLLVFVGYSARNTRFEVGSQGLRIRGGIYGRFIPREEIAGEKVKVIDLKASPEYRPRIRWNGIGLPGYAEGWFKLRNGEKALLFVTDYSRVVHVPTERGYSVLLSVREAEEFCRAMKQWEP